METKFADEFKVKLVLELADLGKVIANELGKAIKENNKIRINLLLDFNEMILKDISETIFGR